MENDSFKRPDHPDFATTAELKTMEFTGMREYKLTGAYQFWILGEIVKEVMAEEVRNDPMALTKAHLEVFHMDNAKPGVRR